MHRSSHHSSAKIISSLYMDRFTLIQVFGCLQPSICLGGSHNIWVVSYLPPSWISDWHMLKYWMRKYFPMVLNRKLQETFIKTLPQAYVFIIFVLTVDAWMSYVGFIRIGTDSATKMIYLHCLEYLLTSCAKRHR